MKVNRGWTRPQRRSLAVPRYVATQREVLTRDVIPSADPASAFRVVPPSTPSERAPVAPAPVLSVVIPTRHEARTIAAFLRRIRRALEGIPAEIVVVDDSDLDTTLAVLCSQYNANGDCLKVFHRPRGSVPERTLGTAVVMGIHAAQGTYVCVMDADGQHPPELIPVMLYAARDSHAEYVGGSRYLAGGSPEGLSLPARKAISRGLALMARCVFVRTPIRRMTDPLSGFFLFRREIVESVCLRPIGWKISLEVLVRCRVKRIVEVPYVFAKRTDGDSKAGISEGLLLLRHMFALLLPSSGSNVVVARLVSDELQEKVGIQQ
jgi:dolichol-phosphate mannosyltransferase